MMRTLLVVALGLGLGCGDNIKLAEDGGVEDDADVTDGGPFDYPNDPSGYEANLISYISEITIPELDQDDDPTCCFDFGSISKNDGLDNAYATFMQEINDLVPLFDAQQEYDELLARNPQDNPLVWLIDHRGLAVGQSDQFRMAFLYGAMEGDTTQPDARAGTGTFTISSRSFEPGTGTPLSAFDAVFFSEPTGAVLSPSGSMFVPFALANTELQLPLEAARVRGTAVPTNDGVSYSRGEISGYITVDDFFGTLNDTLEERCSCIADELPIFTKNVDGDWVESCPTGPTVVNACGGSPLTEVCVGIAGRVQDGGACSQFPLLVPNQVDIDTDGDDEYDAISFGLEFIAARGEVVDSNE